MYGLSAAFSRQTGVDAENFGLVLPAFLPSSDGRLSLTGNIEAACFFNGALLRVQSMLHLQGQQHQASHIIASFDD
jgi:hypothetical protein